MDNFVFNSDNTFCISLLSNKERRQKMEERFKKLNLDVTFWEASTKDTLIDNFVDYLSGVQKACTQSHWNIWKHIVKNDIKYSLILEDDACFDKNWVEKLNQFKMDIHDLEWDSILLNASEEIQEVNKWVQVTEQYLCGGYILSKKGAEILISWYSNCLYMSDLMTTRLQLNGHSYSYFPWLIIQEGNETTINSNIIEDHQKVVRLLKTIDYSLDNYII
jgi:GR25 family glycosyltransferase involved in LPS biosynthesis